MNFGEKEDFFVRHRYFFDGYCFKFEGLSSEKEKELVDKVTKLSGEVSNDADYTLCELSYFRKLKKPRIPYYSIEFIDECISTNILFDIDEYRLQEDKKQVDDNFHVTNEDKILEDIQTESKKSVVCNKNNSFICKNSFIKNELVDSIKNWKKGEPSPIIKQEIVVNEKTKNVTEVIDLSSSESDEVSVKADSPKNLKVLNPFAINARFALKTKKSVEKEQKKLSTKSSKDTLAGPSQKSKTTVVEFINMYENIVEDVTNTPSPLLPSTPSHADSKSASFDNSNSTSSDDDSQSTSSDDNNNGAITISNKTKWWRKLPQPFFKELPSQNIKRRIRGATFSLLEQRTMLAFLIKYKYDIKSYSPASRTPWENMHKKGYLVHRTVESLSNNYRRSILPNIQNFNLPKKYEERFLLVQQ